jgi:CDP-glycerol glycerophosphotransferase
MSSLVSVIVPIYNVEPYLKSCLDSLVAQARDCTLDVVLVDDGSTDASPSIAEEYVERHPYMRLVRKRNGGLGQARNVGAESVRGDYLVFLDSDDVLPEGAYAAMTKALEDARVDFVTGNVVRLKGQSTIISAAHQRSHPWDRAATHITAHQGLLWDTTAWNKMFRRGFWEDHRLAFPEGVLYEDMELMTRSHLLARQVAVLTRTSYLWRIRTEWPPSITQCRTDVQNLDDRFTAIFALFDTLQRYGTPELRDAYQHKILSMDMPIYLRHYGRNDTQQYRDRLEGYVRRALRRCATGAVDRTTSVDRLKYWLMANDRADDIAGLNRCQDTHFDTCPLELREGRVLRTYPTLNESRGRLPTTLVDVTKELSPHTTVYDIRRDERCLLIDVHAFVPGISPEASLAMTRRFYLRNSESGERVELDAVAWTERRPSAMLQVLHFDGAWSRVTLQLPVDAFMEQNPASQTHASWDVWVDCELNGLVWSDRVRRRDGEYMARGHFVDAHAHRVRACLSREDHLQVTVEPMPARGQIVTPARLQEPRSDPWISGLSLDDNGVLRLRLDTNRTGAVQVELVHPEKGCRLTPRRACGASESDRLRYEIDLAHIDVWSFDTPVPNGEWRLVTRLERAADEFEPSVAACVRATLPVECQSNGVRAKLRVNDSGTLVLRVTTDWPEDADIYAKRRRLETDVYPVLRRRPITPSVVFESWGGAAFSDGPRRVYEELSRRVPRARLTWVASDPSALIPHHVPTVLRGTKDYYQALAEARYVVSNIGLPELFEKREGCTYVRLSRGIPVKRIGIDVTGVASLSIANARRLISDAKRWDVLVTGHPESSRIFRKAFGYDGTVFEAGQPRLDWLVAPEADARRARVRARFGISDSERLVLYAPTWRDNLFSKPTQYVMPQELDLAALHERLGDGWRVMVKNHPAVANRMSRRLDERIINAYRYPEMTDLYLAADVLVTDYSSSVFDVAVTRTPVLIFAPDLEVFSERVRGVYWDMAADLPGPVVKSTDALLDHLRTLTDIESLWQSRYDQFHARFCREEDGRSAQRLIEAVFTEWLD